MKRKAGKTFRTLDKVAKVAKTAMAPKAAPRNVKVLHTSFIVRSITARDRILLDVIKNHVRERTDSGAIAAMIARFAKLQEDEQRFRSSYYELANRCIQLHQEHAQRDRAIQEISKHVEAFKGLRNDVRQYQLEHGSYALPFGPNDDEDDEDDED